MAHILVDIQRSGFVEEAAEFVGFVGAYSGSVGNRHSYPIQDVADSFPGLGGIRSYPTVASVAAGAI